MNINNLFKLTKLKDNNNNNILHLLVNENKIEKLNKIFIKNNSLNNKFIKNIINDQNNEGKTPLYFALKNNNLDIIKLLIENGADKDFVNGLGQKITMKGGGYSKVKKQKYSGKRYL